MDNFVVSARKYRPATFKSVVGQASITTTLKNAIQRKQLAQAYLFCGPRGVGKTTCARIFAKTINCQNLTPELEACNECESCKSFNTNRSYNIHELDAASNNSVEDIRKLIEQVRIPPQIGKYSVYIIDEVHMLSQSAFNAFLKTLEEPPAHAIFILATTEKHKILPTILSRCQIFDFNRIRVEDIVNYLEYIAKTEGIDYEVEALNIIAQKADGAMRDALSIFDQVVSFSNNHITYQNVIENLNVLDYQYYFRLTEDFLKGDYADSLQVFDELLSKGFDAQQFITGLSMHLRNILVCHDPKTIPLLEVGAAIAQRYKEMAAACPPPFLIEALQVTNQFDVAFRQSPNHRLHVELMLIKLCGLNQKKKSDDSQVEDSSNTTYTQPQALTAKPIQSAKTNQPPLKTSIHTTSIKNALSGSSQKEDGQKPDDSKTELNQPENNILGNSEENAVSQDEVLKAWISFAEQIQKDRPAHFSLMQLYKPILKDNNAIVIQFEGQLQIDLFNEIKKDLLTHLKKSLSILNIDIVEEIVDNIDDNGKPRLYTPDDKFRFMAERNPALIRFKQRLNLDID
ncbi:MAG TPA: DNA polymerase III subunit gamma/tau [Bacteroidales bacterium]|nr:DNA polymerase III subunit gamma/tau [Bacteroidales bacterium]